MVDYLKKHEHLTKLANEFGTPLYVYDESKIRENVHRLQKCLANHFEKFRIQYPIKTNSNPHLLKIFVKEGLYADCSSPGEVYIAEKTGFDMSQSTYTGNYESLTDFDAALKAGMVINLDDIRVDELSALGKPEILSFRINPGIGRGGFEGIITGGTDAKFGIPYEKTKSAYEKALNAGFTRFGIHMMTGSNILEPFYFAEITQKLLMIAGEAFQPLGIQPEFINIGGGLGIPYSDEETELDLEHTFRHVKNVYEEGIKRYKLGQPTLILEPGRYLIGNAGILLSRITHVKHSYRNYVGMDAGMNTLIRPALYHAYHRATFITQNKTESAPENFYLTGQICENSDIHPVERNLSGLQRGDFCLIHDVGAYGYVMASNYNHRPRPAEVLFSNGSFKLIRQADTLKDLIRNIPGFEQS